MQEQDQHEYAEPESAREDEQVELVLDLLVLEEGASDEPLEQVEGHQVDQQVEEDQVQVLSQ